MIMMKANDGWREHTVFYKSAAPLKKGFFFQEEKKPCLRCAPITEVAVVTVLMPDSAVGLVGTAGMTGCSLDCLVLVVLAFAKT